MNLQGSIEHCVSGTALLRKPQDKETTLLSTLLKSWAAKDAEGRGLILKIIVLIVIVLIIIIVLIRI